LQGLPQFESDCSVSHHNLTSDETLNKLHAVQAKSVLSLTFQRVDSESHSAVELMLVFECSYVIQNA